MNSFPLVSVCIPVFNGEKYISRSLDSVLNQTYKNIEVIVVNDGSADNTAQILGEYEAKGIRVLNQENKGQCAAANKAFRASKGDYIKFFDADDLLSEHFIDNQVRTLGGREDAVASAAWGRFYDDDLNSFRLNKESVWKNMKPIDWLVESMRTGPNMMQCGIWLIPRKILSRSGLWDERLSLINDFDFIIRVLLSAEDVIFTEDAVLYYRSGINKSLSAQRSRKALESALLSTQLGVDSILNYENSERTRKICANAFQIWKYEFYPGYNDLHVKADECIRKLGGSDYPYPSGGLTRILATVLGWKTAKRIKSLLQ